MTILSMLSASRGRFVLSHFITFSIRLAQKSKDYYQAQRLARMKRKATHSTSDGTAAKKVVVNEETVKARFRDGLFDQAVRNSYTTAYAESNP